MTGWTDAARKASAAARQAAAKGRTQHAANVAQAAATVRQSRIAGTIGNESMRMTPKQTPQQTDAAVRAAGQRAKARQRKATPPAAASKPAPKLDAWGRPRMENFPTGHRHELGTYAPVRWHPPKPKRK